MNAVRAGYKQTEVGVIPEDWLVRRCGDIADRIMVGIVIRPSQYYVPNGVPAFRSANVRESGLQLDDLVFISKEANSILAKSQTREGDVLTVRTGYPGTSAVVRPEHAGCNCIDILITRPSKAVDSEFLALWINSPLGKQQVLRNQGGLAQQHFNVGDLSNLLVALPNQGEQRAIAEALSNADALIESLEQLVAKKRHLKQGTMQELLTGKKRLPEFSGEWEVKRLGELGSTYGGLTGKTKADFGHGNGRYITFMNVMSNVTINCEIFEEVDVAVTESQNLVAQGDLLFNGSSETPEEVAMCSLMTGDVSRLFLNSFCFGFRLHNQLDADGLFLTYYIRSLEGRELMKSLAQGSTRYNLSKGALLDAKITLPKKPEQTAIALVLSDMDAEIAELETQLTKTRTLKQGMMHKLLTGEIRLL
jgi:type I restriction enzyme, S subunit